MSLATTVATAIEKVNELMDLVKGQYNKWDNDVKTFKSRIWDEVGSAIGQFNRTLYVDYYNGSDSNSGTSSSPFKTIGKAVTVIPYGGKGWINIIGEYVHDTGISIDNKDIVIYYKEKFIIKWKNNGENSAVINPIGMNNSSLTMYANTSSDGVAPTIESINDTGLPLGNSSSRIFIKLAEFHGHVSIQFFYRNRVVDAKLMDLRDTKLVSSTYGANDQIGTTHLGISGYYKGDICLDAGSLLADINRCGLLSYKRTLNGISFKDENGDALDDKTKFSGVIRDTNGVPRNIQSNLVF